MDSRQALDNRLQALVRDLSFVQIDLERMQDVRLKARLKGRFDSLSKDLIREAEDLRANVGNGPLAKRWAEFRTLSGRISDLIGECLAFRVGEATRRMGLDQGLCAVADHLLDEFSDKAEAFWNRLTLLDRSDLFRGMSQIVRIRFPASIWDLPLVAHEYGHFLCLQLTKRDFEGNPTFPFRELLQQWSGDPGFTEREGNHFKELFCDAFATYVMGPAFAYAQVHRRFDPTQKTEGSYTHPGDDARVRLILKILEKVDEARGPFSKQYAPVITDLSQTWMAWREGVETASAEYSRKSTFWAGMTSSRSFARPQLEPCASTTGSVRTPWLIASHLSATRQTACPPARKIRFLES